MTRARGFTLIEVLIALAIVALALLALTRTAAQQVEAFDGLRERTLAGWVAANVLADARLAPSAAPVGNSDGRVRFAARDWRWHRQVKATPAAAIRRIDISVFIDGAEQPSATLTGFAAEQPLP